MNGYIPWRLRAALFAIMIATGALIVLSVCGAWISVTDEAKEFIRNNEMLEAYFISDITPVFAADTLEYVLEDFALEYEKITQLFVTVIYIYIGVMMYVQLNYVWKTFTTDITEKFIGGASGIFELVATVILGLVPCVIGNVISGDLHEKLFFTPGSAFWWAIVLSAIRILCVSFIYLHQEKMRKRMMRVVEEVKAKQRMME